jgi:hypothetical protein
MKREEHGDVADLILVNGRLITVDPRDTITEAVAIRNGRILKLGDNEAVKSLAGKNTRTVDLAGKTVTPGLVDSHGHFAEAGLDSVFILNLRYPGVTRIPDIAKLVEERVERSGEGEWIQGSGWNEALLDEKRYPTRWDIDPVSQHNPVVLRHVTGHCILANSLSLKLGGISKETPEPSGGTILRDHTGEPTGVLKEFAAMNMVLRLVPEWTTEQWMRGIRHATKLSEGVTATKKNYPRGQYESIIAAYRTLIAKGEMKIRSHVLCRAETVEDVRYAVNHPDDFLAHSRDDLLKLGGIKVLLDGSLVARTALMYDEFCDPATGRPQKGNRGYLSIPEDELTRIVETAHVNGFQIAVHAIGDRAIDLILDVYEGALKREPRANQRHSIVHALLPTSNAIQRVRALDIVIETQTPFLYFLADGYSRCVRSDVLKRIIPLRTILDAGITVGNGSDAPCYPHPPRYGLWAACTRRSLLGREGEGFLGKEESISIIEALQTYTIYAAKCLMLEDRIGLLEEGKLADLVVWDEDMLSIPIDEVRDLEALMTIIDGKIVFQR